MKRPKPSPSPSPARPLPIAAWLREVRDVAAALLDAWDRYAAYGDEHGTGRLVARLGVDAWVDVFGERVAAPMETGPLPGLGCMVAITDARELAAGFPSRDDRLSRPVEEFMTPHVVKLLELAVANIDAELGPETTQPRTEPSPIRVSGNDVAVGGSTYVLDDAQVAFVRSLVDAGVGVWVSGTEMGELAQPRPDRVRAKLPEPVRARIESAPFKGYRLRPGPLA